MGTEAGLALAVGFFGGMFVTAVALGIRERATRRVLDDVSVRRRRNEARTHALLRESGDVLTIVAGDGIISYVSPAADRVLGRSGTTFVGSNPTSLVHPDDVDRVAAALAAAAAAPGQSERLEFRDQHDDGHSVLFEATVDDRRDDAAVDGIVIAGRAVSERRRTEAELREAQGAVPFHIRARADRHGTHRPRRPVHARQPCAGPHPRPGRRPARRRVGVGIHPS